MLFVIFVVNPVDMVERGHADTQFVYVGEPVILGNHRFLRFDAALVLLAVVLGLELLSGGVVVAPLGQLVAVNGLDEVCLASLGRSDQESPSVVAVYQESIPYILVHFPSSFSFSDLIVWFVMSSL